MWKKVSTIALSTFIAVGIIFFMLFSVWDDLLLAVEHAIWYYLILAALV